MNLRQKFDSIISQSIDLLKELEVELRQYNDNEQTETPGIELLEMKLNLLSFIDKSKE